MERDDLARAIYERTHLTGEFVLAIVEDVVSSGGQVIMSCNDLRERGAIVEHAVIVIDLRPDGPDALAAIGVELRALYTMSELTAAEAGTHP